MFGIVLNSTQILGDPEHDKLCRPGLLRAVPVKFTRDGEYFPAVLRCVAGEEQTYEVMPGRKFDTQMNGNSLSSNKRP